MLFYLLVFIATLIILGTPHLKCSPHLTLCCPAVTQQYLLDCKHVLVAFPLHLTHFSTLQSYDSSLSALCCHVDYLDPWSGYTVIGKLV